MNNSTTIRNHSAYGKMLPSLGTIIIYCFSKLIARPPAGWFTVFLFQSINLNVNIKAAGGIAYALSLRKLGRKEDDKLLLLLPAVLDFLFCTISITIHPKQRHNRSCFCHDVIPQGGTGDGFPSLQSKTSVCGDVERCVLYSRYIQYTALQPHWGANVLLCFCVFIRP